VVRRIEQPEPLPAIAKHWKPPMRADRLLSVVRLGSWLVFALVLACESTNSSVEVGPPPPVNPRRIEKAEPLPDVATSWKAPALDVEQGRCWSRLNRLPEAVIEATRTEFWARNPDWRSDRLGVRPGVDPFTGHLSYIESPRHHESHGPSREPVELSDEVFETRKLSRLRRNADLFGLKPAELDALEWRPGGFESSLQEYERPALARIPCRGEADRLAAGRSSCGLVRVTFLEDGTVSSVSVARWGPPVEVCTTPTTSVASVRSGGTRMNARTREHWKKRAKSARAVGEPRLGIRDTTEGDSKIWRLAWTVDVEDAHFFVDATSGESLGFQYIITNCFPRDDSW
jgi:hypothetical protein